MNPLRLINPPQSRHLISVSIFVIFRARPPKYISKIVIVVIWVLSSLFSLPFMIAFRVFDVVDTRYSKYFRLKTTPMTTLRYFTTNASLGQVGVRHAHRVPSSPFIYDIKSTELNVLAFIYSGRWKSLQSHAALLRQREFIAVWIASVSLLFDIRTGIAIRA